MYKYIKRFFDIVSSFVGLVALSPLLIPIVIALRFTAEGYVFYKQKRIGFENNFFEIFKFATMLKDSPNLGTGSLTVRNDPRVTPVGKYLRKSKINELPQILNVFFGTMSVVGPRPQMMEDFKAYTQEVQDKIYSVKPGITGIGSIVFRDEELLMTNTKLPIRQFYSEVIAPYKGELEMWYLKNISFITDLKLLIITFWIILFPKSNIIDTWFPSLPKRNF